MEVAVKPHTFQGKEWDPKKHVQEMPTDAFGDIVFTDLSQKVGKVGSLIPSPLCWPRDTVTVLLVVAGRGGCRMRTW